MNAIIRDAIPADGLVIADYNSRLSAETEDVPLDRALIGPGVAAVLDDRSKGRYWVAESDGRVIGQIMVTYEWSDWRNGMLWWIQSVYVHTDFRRKGVFSMLFRHIEALAEAEEDVVGIRLYVESDNDRAQATYDRLGMSKTTYQVMQVLTRRNEMNSET